jgi:diaminohydroxyphosphoribosylaminopyrimidine deaminase / 5-amino-6-(5-phosphoribosylamino)uracil reductase
MENRTLSKHEMYMHRCLQLASIGAGYVAPNPMVGAILVLGDKIISEGYHKKYGQSHAEPNAIHQVKNPDILKQCTLYVNLEPCSHYGKTPPCADLIVRSGIPKVVIGTLDPNPKVAGRGVQILRSAGIEVAVGILEAECRELNKRFFTFQEKKRPFVLLKWAQTADGFIDIFRTSVDVAPLKISNPITEQLTHKMRSENQAILVGTNTVLLDNPSLTVRNWHGKNPVRVALDRQGLIPENYNLLDDQHPTIIINGQKTKQAGKQTEFISAEFSNTDPSYILKILYERNIHSVLVEGGASLLNCFLNSGLWDEANIEISIQLSNTGVKAPVIDVPFVSCDVYENHKWVHHKNYK